MGLKDKMLAKSAEIAERKGFTPLELTEGNVQAIFNRCLAKEGSKLNTSILFLKKHSFSEDSKPIYFDFDKITVDFKNIGYLLGQLDLFHKDSPTMIPTLAVKKYEGSSWASSGTSVTELMHLASVSGYLHDFRKNGSEIDAPVVSKIKPTLSPKDPNFPAWWEEHKHEWEQ